jgi:hypothetical protein
MTPVGPACSGSPARARTRFSAVTRSRSRRPRPGRSRPRPRSRAAGGARTQAWRGHGYNDPPAASLPSRPRHRSGSRTQPTRAPSAGTGARLWSDRGTRAGRRWRRRWARRRTSAMAVARIVRRANPFDDPSADDDEVRPRQLAGSRAAAATKARSVGQAEQCVDVAAALVSGDECRAARQRRVDRRCFCLGPDRDHGHLTGRARSIDEPAGKRKVTSRPLQVAAAQSARPRTDDAHGNRVGAHTGRGGSGERLRARPSGRPPRASGRRGSRRPSIRSCTNPCAA